MTINSTLGPDGYTVSIPAPVSGARFWSPLLVGAIGDSRMANALQDQSVGAVKRVNWSSQGALTWLLTLARGRMYMPTTYDKAVGGATVAQIAAQVAGLLTLSPLPRICFVNGGTNTFSTAWADADKRVPVDVLRTMPMPALRARVEAFRRAPRAFAATPPAQGATGIAALSDEDRARAEKIADPAARERFIVARLARMGGN